MTYAKKLHSFIVTGLGIMLLTGCVSTSKYKKMEENKNQQLSQMQKDLTTCQQNLDALAAQKAEMEKNNAHVESQYNALLGQLADEVHNGQLKVTQYKNMLTVDVAEKIFFSSGSSMLKDGGKQILKKLADALKSYPDKYVRVVGHTDNVPVSKATQATYPTNWELSAIRSTNVVRFLQESGFPPERLIISARGEYQPIAPNDTPENKQKNRRIEIMLLDKSLVESIQKPK